MSEQYTETVVIIRPSFKKITAKEEKTDACRAALFNHFLYWIARKAKGLTEEQIQNGEFSWWATEDQITTDGLGEAWCKKKVSKEIDILVANELVGRRHNTTNKWDQTRHYYLSEKEGAKIKEHCIKEGICLNHLGLPPCVVQLLESLNAIGQYSIWKCQICRMSNGKCTTAIPKVSTKVSTKGVVILTDTDSQSTDTHTLSDVSPDYTTNPTIENAHPSMQLSTQANSNVDKLASGNENGSQKSYSQRPTTRTPLKLVREPDEENSAAKAVCEMYDEVALGKGKKSGHAPWDLKAAESLAAEHATEEEIRLVYTHLKKNNRKYSIVHVWESWAELATLKKPAASPGRPSSDGDIGVSGRRRFRAPEGFGEPRKIVGGVK